MQQPIMTLDNEQLETVGGGLDLPRIIHDLIDLVIPDHCPSDPT